MPQCQLLVLSAARGGGNNEAQGPDRAAHKCTHLKANFRPLEEAIVAVVA